MARRIPQPGVSVQEEVRIGTLPRIRSIPVLGLLLLGLLASGFIGALPAVARFLLAFSLVSWIPGGLLATRLLRLEVGGPAQKAVLWFTTGLAALSLLTWPAKLAGLSFTAYSVIVQWGLALVFALTVVLDAKLRVAAAGSPPAPGAPHAKSSAPAQYGLAAVAFALALFVILQPPRFDYHQDSFDHIGYVRHVRTENSLSPDGVLAPPVEEDGGRVQEDPRKGTFQILVALAARVAATDPIEAWRALPAVMFPLAFLAFTWFCTVFLPRGRLVWGCAALFLLFQGGTGVLHGLEFANGQGVWLVFYWTLVPLCLRYAADSAPRGLWVVLVVLAGGALMHVGVAAHYAVLAVSLLAFHRWLRLGLGPVVRLCVGGGLAAGLVVAWKYATAIGPGNDIHVHPQGILYLGERLFVASPVEVLRQNGLVFFGGLTMLPFLLLARRHAGVRLQLSFAAIPLVVCFFPPLVPLLYDAAAYMVFRTILNIPSFAVVTSATYLLVLWSRRRRWPAGVAAAAVLLAWSKLFLVPGIAAFERSYLAREAVRQAPPLTERYRSVIGFLNDRPRASVVLSDPATSYLLSAATDHRFVAVLDQHGNPGDPYAYDRLAAARDVLSPFVYLSLAVAACQRYGVDYVVLNGRLRDPPPGLLNAWSPALYEPARERFGALGERFGPLYESEDVTVYAYRPGPVPNDVWAPSGTPLVLGVPGLRRCVVGAPQDAFFIVEAGVEPERVLPGETVEVSLGYQVPEAVPYGRPYVVHIRFDHHTIALDPGGYFFDKQVRRFRERRGGYQLRHRVDHRPFGGVLPVDQWPTGTPVYESFPVKLPPTLKPGTYVVEFSIDRETLLPNFWLRDFVYNRDHYSGKECLTVDVTRQLVR